ncbi:hypothetical protein SLS60_011093 [Paraconiothyrium brasiliense]|uniref:Uncharacterized protein n=1 Tax=Paraconiothyrium brasiliense TaxID=300254 RepID=A0ABR3QLF5_9PLEO
MPALNGKRRRNALTTPSKNAPSVMGPLTTPQMQGNAVGGGLTPNAGVTAEQIRAMRSTTPAPNTPDGSLAGGASSAPPSTYTPLSASQQQLFRRWFANKVTGIAKNNQTSGSASEADFLILSDDVAVRNQAVQNVYNFYVRKGIDVKAQFLKEVQQSQARQQQQKSQVETQTGAPSTMQMNAQPGAAPTIPQNGNTQDGNLFNWLPSVAEPTKQPSLPPPRRSPRLQASQLANTSGILPNAGQMRNPMQHPPALYSQEAMRALSNINALRQAPTMNNSFTPNGFAPLRPQKPMPNNAWNSPAAATNLFQANIPTFPLPQPGQNGGLQQHNGAFQQNNGGFQQNNGGYPQNNGRFQQNNGGFQQNNGAFQKNNRAFQQNNGAFQQNNGGYQFIDDDLEITGSKRKIGTADDDNEPPKRKKAGPNGPASQP